ncbi:MAG TPA: DNA polymerase III subunit chi [Coxiellaceae bacterium]|nr:DNA polymerase III subunit chi [Coxiellaceae bacterium]
MTRVDFYLTSETNKQDILRFACRVLEKAYEQNCHVYVLAENMAQANQLNDLLWTFRDISFIPHQLVDTSSEVSSPIQIGCDMTRPSTQEILLNLQKDIPTIFNQFQRIIEIISNESMDHQRALEHQQFFETHACEIHRHDLRKK